MKQFIGAISLLVPSYEAGLDFYVDKLGFDLIEDTDLGNSKRWLLVAPKGSHEARVLLAKASGDKQEAAIGNQTGGRVGFFLHTDNFMRDYESMAAKGVTFLEDPRHEPYGSVAVFQDPFGNKWDLIERA